MQQVPGHGIFFVQKKRALDAFFWLLGASRNEERDGYYDTHGCIFSFENSWRKSQISAGLYPPQKKTFLTRFDFGFSPSSLKEPVLIVMLTTTAKSSINA
ncbi:hypothetical protein [Wenzhouxiangella limi]|uniref:Uncharacterized protein n=1 Tax=Wenzhouxiangella limi TaxID=2707351 RepID=A0A845UYA6_9GAMM|nr:hypothetical protein [Wenzhouxiangella limi]NDY95484.1 hypothetical protein [Wenzhouxiangella limi]